MTINSHHNKILKNLNILYIEDEASIKENVKKTLELFCDNVYDEECIENAKKTLEKNRIDIIISDINLPDISGIDFIKQLRMIDKTIPVIILSAYTDKNYLLEATKLKLVDYLTKPIDFKSLNSALNKCVDEILDNSRYIISFKNNIQYNVLHKKLIDSSNDKEIALTSKELTLLELLIKNSNRVLSTDELKTSIWEDEFEATDSALKNLLNKLRKKIGKESIINISSVGYRLDY
ncbi:MULTISPECIES: response regulator transcription factor [Arcobacter]|uniref:Transcriptional regulator n=1 Tax=Arcobacter ellisii TaxID=913109 RepID=A0A347U576_9BACT|nr:response regulator transcription factor [Arcobacter ellisii]AXX94004.1 two-component system response regulator [Arcobacter ellisii]RXI32366.1 transcriptional regulator [Arcobacter ellisii]